MIKKKICILLITFILICALAGCESNSVNFYIGKSLNCDENSLINNESGIDIKQDKIKIENNSLKFTKNKQNNFDSLYFSFDGNNIESVSFESENTKMLNTNLGEHSYYVDSFSLYKEVTEDMLKSDFSDCKSGYDEENHKYDSTKILKKLWDNGEFDDIKNVYFGGESSDRVFLTGSANNKTYDITGIFINENFNIDDTGKFEKPYKSETNNMGKTGESSNMFFQWHMTNHLYDEKSDIGKDMGFESDSIILQPDEVTIKYNQSKYNSVRWVYEILYNNAVKNGKTESLIGEDTIKINVKYTFAQSENYKLNCKLYADGKITLMFEK